MKSSNLWWCSSASIALGLFNPASAANTNDTPAPPSVVSADDLHPALYAVSVNG